ncbi:MAG: 3'-5' exonuclease [Gallionella sp.]|nr:3'-5' exonuclease [Gallionella sp.]MDD4947047.1 3'-5' exonuclease [Gallionella sp.]MDD5612155.1 3'-5' exonuclease [Gallionella sp.]
MKNWLTRWLGGGVQLDAHQKQRLADWQALPRPSSAQPFDAGRCVVVDVEASGLNLMEDRLISIGAVAVVNGKVALGDSFYVVLQQATVSDKHNILLHGIGGAAQTEGKPAADALLGFLEYLRRDPLVAFHVTYDQTMIQRAIRQFLGVKFRHSWSDLAYLMPALNPALASRYRSLDDWADSFGILNDARHNALADALVTAQLLQIGFSQCGRRNIADFSGLRDLEEAQRWVSMPV